MHYNTFDTEFWTRENYFAFADIQGPKYMDKRIESEGLDWGKEPSIGAEKALNVLTEYNINKVLDFGCGYARDAFFLAKNGINVTGIEYSKLAVDKANIEFKQEIQTKKSNKWGKMEVINQDFRKWKSDKKYPAIFTFKTLHQFRYNPYLEHGFNIKNPLSVSKIVDKVYDCLEDNGLFILSTFNTNDHNYGKGKFIEEETWDTRGYRPCTFYDSKKMYKMLNKFEIIKFEEIKVEETHKPDGPHEHKMWFIIAQKVNK